MSWSHAAFLRAALDAIPVTGGTPEVDEYGYHTMPGAPYGYIRSIVVTDDHGRTIFHADAAAAKFNINTRPAFKMTGDQYAAYAWAKARGWA